MSNSSARWGESTDSDVDIMGFEGPSGIGSQKTTKPQNAGGPRKIKPLTIKLRAPPRSLVEQVERDIDNISLQVGKYWRTFNYVNLFAGAGGYSSWPQEAKDRYIAADASLWREYIVAMHSPSFKTALQSLSVEDWGMLHERIFNNRGSLRIFTIMRRIPYDRNNERASMPGLVGPLQAHRYVAEKFPKGVIDAEQVFLCDNGDLSVAKIDSRIVR
jgi:hypothetical protein